MTAQERALREARQRNLDYALKTAATSPQQLARKLKCETNYISQLRNGFRAITFETARQIEEAEGWTRLSLDDPPSSVTSFSDTDVSEKIPSIVRNLFAAHKRLPRGELYEAAVRLCIVDARERGFSEGRVRFIVEEFLK